MACGISTVDAIYYTGAPDDLAAVDGGGTVWDLIDIYYSPSIQLDTADITAGDENPTVTITSDIAFKEDISKDDITFNSGTTGLTLDSVSLAQVTRAVDNKTLVLQFTGTAQAGNLDITVMDSAFAENVGTIDGEINPSIPTIAVGGSTTEPTTPTTPTTPASPGYTPAPTPSVNPEGDLPGADVAPPPEPMPPDSPARSPDWVKDGAVAEGIKRREKAIETILSTVTAETPSEIVRQLNRWLTEHNQYNTTPDLTTIDNSHRQRGAICASLR